MLLLSKKLNKKSIGLIALLICILVVTACSPISSEYTPPQGEDLEDLQEFTLEELAEYNGEDGKKAYIAVDGIVYDVTNSSPWRGGKHNGFTAGRDLTKEIKNDSPHGVPKLANVPVVGKVKE
ncbi:MAG: hypothetical protein GX815_09960 [Clostridiales bacterium]|jgi:predicted heme/steroid binding protein|nr:hypothetical protein [Clostridiales bacterium]